MSGDLKMTMRMLVSSGFLILVTGCEQGGTTMAPEPHQPKNSGSRGTQHALGANPKEALQQIKKGPNAPAAPKR